MSLDKLSADLRKAVNDVNRDVKKVVKRGATNIKREWRSGVRRYREDGSIKALPSSIDYDEFGGAGYSRAEIGYNKEKAQGALGNLVEFGSVNNSPQNHGGRALAEEEPKSIAEMRKLGDIL